MFPLYSKNSDKPSYYLVNGVLLPTPYCVLDSERMGYKAGRPLCLNLTLARSDETPLLNRISFSLFEHVLDPTFNFDDNRLGCYIFLDENEQERDKVYKLVKSLGWTNVQLTDTGVEYDFPEDMYVCECCLNTGNSENHTSTSST